MSQKKETNFLSGRRGISFNFKLSLAFKKCLCPIHLQNVKLDSSVNFLNETHCVVHVDLKLTVIFSSVRVYRCKLLCPAINVKNTFIQPGKIDFAK